MSITVPNRLPSNRSFGSLFTVVFALLAGYGKYAEWSPIQFWTFACLAGLTLLATIFAPNALTFFNRLWFLFGELLGKIVSPVVLGVIFFGLLTPVSVLTRLFGRDELRLKRTESSSYWIGRKPPGPEPESFKNQF